MARTSVRTSATSGQASSPRRRTRSQSAEPQQTIQRTAPKRSNNRARQISIESDRSDASVQSMSKRRKLGRRAVDPELSIVAESPEDGREEDNEGNNEQAAKWALTETSPRESQYSGTTAYTSHSQEQLRDMDPSLIVDHLPELFSTACGLLDLVAPKKVVTEDRGSVLEHVESVLKDLKVPGSRRSQNLKRKEGLFHTNREHYGATEFIDLQLTLRKLFITPTPSDSDIRPDAILYAANLAIAVKDMLVKPKENQSTHIHLRGLEAKFPQAFVSTFSKGKDVGRSKLVDKTFELALDILTQAVIADLSHPHEDDDMAFEPDNILAGSFYGTVPGPDQTIEELDKFYDSEPVLDILRYTANSNAQKAKIRKRVSDIRDTFRYTSAAIENGDQVDFEALNDKFPWLDFITNMVVWSRLRLDELVASVTNQGGSQSITEALQTTVDVESPESPIVPPPRLQPAAVIKSKSEGSKYMRKAKLLDKILDSHDKLSLELSSAQEQPRHTSSLPSSSIARSSARQPSGLSESNGKSQDPEEDRRQSSSRALVAWERDTEERNKENLRGHGTAITSQSDAVNSQLPVDIISSRVESRSSRKHSRDVRDDEESDVSEGSGFQSDSRVPNPNKRAKLSANLPTQVSRVSNSATHRLPEVAEEDDITRQNRINLQRALQAGAQEDYETANISADEDTVPDSTQARATAKVAVARAKVAKPPRVQTRKPWSLEDENHLVDLIENYGTSWSILLQQSDFEREETQVGLKDKARNLKVAFMKAGTPEAGLPTNFDRIPLGKKEWRAIKAAQPGIYSDDDE